MTNDLNFTKMNGAGNDFIVVDNREGVIGAEGRSERFVRWCERRVGIGADGVLLVEPPLGAGADFRMRYYNADGGEADMCGNGARCIARFANLIGAAGGDMAFETEAGLLRARVLENQDVILDMSDPHSLRRGVALGLEGAAKADYLNTGVPHAVVFVPDVGAIAALDFARLGREVRNHSSFSPAGANANFATRLADGRLAMRTYERGVEGETLACGTGACAVGIVAHLHGIAASPVTIVTSGGPELKIHFDAPDHGVDGGEEGSGDYRNVRLEGEARIVYEGVLSEAGAHRPIATPAARA